MKDFANVEGIYEFLAAEAIAVVPSDAQRVWARSEISDGASVTGVYYLNRWGEHHAVFDEIQKIDGAFNSLHGAIAANGDAPFSTAVLTIDRRKSLFRDRIEFSIDYSYADVSDIENSDQRSSIWREETFGRNVVIHYDD